MKSLLPLIFAVLVVVFLAGCGGNEVRLVMETRRSADSVSRGYHVPSEIAPGEDQLKDESFRHYYSLSRYFGVLGWHYRSYSDGLKPVRTSLLEKGPEYIFELETLGSIESARREYDWRMQVAVTFCWELRPEERIVCNGCSNEALLVSGSPGDVVVRLGRDGRAEEARQESEYEVKAKLRLELRDKVLKIHVPKELMPGRDRLKNPGKSFGWSVNVGFAPAPLDPIPTNTRDIYWVPEIHRIDCPRDGYPVTFDTPSWRIIVPPKDNASATPPTGE
jgi:hypothetical protein